MERIEKIQNSKVGWLFKYVKLDERKTINPEKKKVFITEFGIAKHFGLFPDKTKNIV